MGCCGVSARAANRRFKTCLCRQRGGSGSGWLLEERRGAAALPFALPRQKRKTDSGWSPSSLAPFGVVAAHRRRAMSQFFFLSAAERKVNEGPPPPGRESKRSTV